VSVVASRRALAPLRTRRVATGAGASGALAPRHLVAAARRGRRVAGGPRRIADGACPPDRHARRRAGRSLHRRLGRRSRRHRAHPDAPHHTTRRGHGALVGGRDGRGHRRVGPPVRGPGAVAWAAIAILELLPGGWRYDALATGDPAGWAHATAWAAGGVVLAARLLARRAR